MSLASLLFQGCSDNNSTEPEILPGCEGPAGPTTFEVTTLDNGGRLITATGDITQAVEYFKSLIADDEPRDIHWDDIPADLTNTNDFPGSYFNSYSAGGWNYSRGEIGFAPSPYSDNGLRVSDNNFRDINPTYNTQFLPFSSPKTFAPIGTNTISVSFIFEGSGSPMFFHVRGFGVVFSDVDVAGTTFLKLSSYYTGEIGVFDVPANPGSCSLSFIGFVFDSHIISSVTITSGQAALGSDVYDISNGGAADLVIMDNFIYSEAGYVSP